LSTQTAWIAAQMGDVSYVLKIGVSPVSQAKTRDVRPQGFDKIIPTRVGSAFRFSVTSRGVKGSEWFETLKKQNIPFGKFVPQLLQADTLGQSTSDVTYYLEVVLGDHVVRDENRDLPRVQEYFKRRGCGAPPAEVACLACDIFTPKCLMSMGVSRLIFMHEPIVFEGIEYLLDIDITAGKMKFGAHCGRKHVRFSRSCGFVSLISLARGQSA